MIKSSFKILSVILFFAVSISFFSIGSCGSDGGGTGAVVNPCGNGKLDEGEKCDDGNVDNLDGCDSQCNIDVCFECSKAGEKCSLLALGSLCEADKYCDSEGKCGDRCNDDTMDGNETGVDCGDPALTGCKKCDGADCMAGADCVSLSCVDGVCCGGECTGTCKACNIPNKEGICTDIFAGIDDNFPIDSCTGNNMKTCDGSGSCVNNKKENGEACIADDECASKVCSPPTGGNRKCGLDTGDACVLNGECASGNCTNNFCQ